MGVTAHGLLSFMTPLSVAVRQWAAPENQGQQKAQNPYDDNKNQFYLNHGLIHPGVNLILYSLTEFPCQELIWIFEE